MPLNLIPYYVIDIICTSITFRKITNHTKYKQPNVPSHLHILGMNFDKANHSLLHYFLLLGETDSKNSSWSFDWRQGR